MAAHVYTFIRDIAENNYNSLDSIKFALGHCQAGDQLDFNDWELLYNATDLMNLRETATAFRPKYFKLWEFLGKPATAEEWNQVRFNLKKHHKHSAFLKLFWCNYAKS